MKKVKFVAAALAASLCITPFTKASADPKEDIIRDVRTLSLSFASNMISIYSIQKISDWIGTIKSAVTSSTDSGFVENADVLERRLNEIFKKKVFLSEENKQSIIERVVAFWEYVKEIKREENSEECFNILYFIGESGVGKSVCAEAVADALLTDPKNNKLIINSGTVTNDKHLSLKQQLFSSPNFYSGGSGGYGAATSAQKAYLNSRGSCLAAQALSHPQSVVIINEYDKFSDAGVDEAFRAIGDEGLLMDSSGKTVDFSKCLFILTSNEDKSCFPSRFPEVAQSKKSEEPNDSENKSEKDNSSEDQGLYGTTKKKHDASFVKRIPVIPFERLGSTEFKAIAKNFLNQRIEFFKDQYKINMRFDDSIFESIAEFASQTTYGGRAITKELVAPLSAAVHKARSKYRNGNFKLEFSFDGTNPHFNLTREFGEKDDVENLLNLASLCCYGNDRDSKLLREYLSEQNIDNLKGYINEIEDNHSYESEDEDDYSYESENEDDSSYEICEYTTQDYETLDKIACILGEAKTKYALENAQEPSKKIVYRLLNKFKKFVHPNPSWAD